MQLTVLLIALVCVRWFGVPAWVQQDGWVKPWLDSLRGLGGQPWVYWAIALLLPLAIVYFGLDWVAGSGWLLSLLLTTWVLLYSIGRADFKAQLQAFTRAVGSGDLQNCLRAARALQTTPASEALSSHEPELYQQTMLNAGYRAMERLFVVFFWFATLGPIAALAYRLLRLYQDQQQQQLLAEGEQVPPVPQELVARMIWLLEWPVVRLLALSFAITGNFTSCMQRWRHSLLCLQTPSKQVLGNAIGGALDFDADKVADSESIISDLGAMQALFYRTGLFWLCALALYLIVAI
ncbi:MAG: regulatory signaling modulator protein AmpE [Cellvibrionaceae bacterium]|nr:regulatory signaling modulator protein AmpE [Cellvibrionaceae bacterium]